MGYAICDKQYAICDKGQHCNNAAMQQDKWSAISDR